MNWIVIIIETLVMTVAFTAMVLIPLVKNPVWWIHDLYKTYKGLGDCQPLTQIKKLKKFLLFKNFAYLALGKG